ncbi:MAG: hypothetical protein LH632_08995 [Rhodoferax sp.]|nr:hypothetical protein [Rhodoferax sp.]
MANRPDMPGSSPNNASADRSHGSPAERVAVHPRNERHTATFATSWKANRVRTPDVDPHGREVDEKIVGM